MNLESPQEDYPAHNFHAKLAGLSELNQNAIVKKINEDAIDLRAAIITKMMRHGALKNGKGWAIFEINPEEEGGSVATFSTQKNILVMTYVGTNPEISNLSAKPTIGIRLLTNEVVPVGDQYALITEDFTLDQRNKTQYLMSALAGDKDDRWGPYFAVKSSGELGSNDNLFSTTPIVRINPANYEAEPVPEEGPETTDIMPFGIFICPEDGMYAIDKAKEILALIVHLEPVASRAGKP